MPLDQALIDRIGERVARMRADFDTECPDGVVRLPFRCYGCDRRKMDFALITGDGLPMCEECIDGCVRAMQGAQAK